jgi:hypothetical protein
MPVRMRFSRGTRLIYDPPRKFTSGTSVGRMDQKVRGPGLLADRAHATGLTSSFAVRPAYAGKIAREHEIPPARLGRKRPAK